jgi:carboxypeptidase Taq
MSQALHELRERLAEIADLSDAAGLLGWDQQTMMPARAAEQRAEQLGTLGRIVHERFTDAAIGRLLDEADGALAAAEDGSAGASADAALLRVTRRDWEKARRVPSDLAAELARAGALGHAAWVDARERSDFGAFLPALERNVELKLRYVACFDGYDDPYDVLLDDYEEGMTSAEVDVLFAELRAGLVPLIAAVAERAAAVDDAPLHGDFPVERQRALVRAVVERLGWSPDGWRLDDAAHPFATSFGRATCASRRATTRRTWGPRCTGRSTSSATASTNRRSTRRSPARRSARASRSACTSRRAACGRTSWGGVVRSPAGCTGSSPARSPSASRGWTPTASTARSTACSRR